MRIGPADGPPLVGRFWTVDRPRGVVVIAHGLGEHGGAYRHVAEFLAAKSRVDVLAFDFRGHGRSHGKRGVILEYSELVEDLRAALRWAAAERPGPPIFALGHSNGGQVVLRGVLEGLPELRGVVLSNPALRVATPIPPWKLSLGRFLLHVAPRVAMKTDVAPESLTHDAAMILERREDPLRHSKITGPLFFGMVEGGDLIDRRAAEIRVPVLMVLGLADPIIDPAFSANVFDRLGSSDKSLRTYAEMLHEPFNEVDRDRPLGEVARWISARL